MQYASQSLSIILVLTLLTGAAAALPSGSGNTGLTGKLTAEEASKAVSSASNEVDEAEKTVKDASESATGSTDITVTADAKSNGALKIAKKNLQQAKKALEQGKYNQSAAAAEKAKMNATEAQRLAIEQKINATEDSISTFYSLQDTLVFVIGKLSDTNAGFPKTLTAVNASNETILLAEDELVQARADLKDGNLTEAQEHADEAKLLAKQARKTLQDAPVKAELQTAVNAKVQAFGKQKAKTKASVRTAKYAYGAGEERKQATKEYSEAEKSYEDAQQAHSQISEAETLSDAVSSAKQAATTLDAASENLQSAQKSAQAAQSEFYKHSALVAMFVAILGSGGFLYYRMNGGWEAQQKRKHEENEKTQE